MGALTAALRTFLYDTLLFSSRISAALKSNTKLHTARFAALHETADLHARAPDLEESLLLGTGPLAHVLRVKPTPARRERGNLLVVAPTRGGKGLLAVSQLLSWGRSVIVNDIKGDLFQQSSVFKGYAP